MTADPTLATLRERHRRYQRSTRLDYDDYRCAADGQGWPCDAELLRLDAERFRQALDAALGERDAANEDAERLADLLERVTGYVDFMPVTDGEVMFVANADHALAAHRARVATEGSET